MVRETKTEIDPLGYSVDTLIEGATTECVGLATT